MKSFSTPSQFKRLFSALNVLSIKLLIGLAIVIGGIVISAKPMEASNLINFFDTPIAINADQGEYQIGFSFYDSGGLMSYAGIGINSFLSLGIKNYIEGIVGSQSVSFSTPGVFAKLTITDHPKEDWNVAFGYNSIHNGSFSEYDQRLYGVYGVVSRGFFLWLPYPHLFSFGVHYPLVPVQGNISLFSSFISQLNEIVVVGAELSNIQFNTKDRKYVFISNGIVGLNLSEQLTLKFVFQAAQRYQENGTDSFDFSRNILLYYKNYF